MTLYLTQLSLHVTFTTMTSHQMWPGPGQSEVRNNSFPLKRKDQANQTLLYMSHEAMCFSCNQASEGSLSDLLQNVKTASLSYQKGSNCYVNITKKHTSRGKKIKAHKLRKQMAPHLLQTQTMIWKPLSKLNQCVENFQDPWKFTQDSHSWMSPPEHPQTLPQECNRHLTCTEHCLTWACTFCKVSLMPGEKTIRIVSNY